MTSVNASKRSLTSTPDTAVVRPTGPRRRVRCGVVAALLSTGAVIGAGAAVNAAAASADQHVTANRIAVSSWSPYTGDGGPWPWKVTV